ncbi:BrnT family toxin, partial [Candidatus Magnetaquicoccus inordinatus]|uniref:BrnT family toxin n=1 Tax=Candidatus Magnetaquicoccus inordinatus TaxID=2496818 RepID=UPI00102B06A9
MKIAFDASKDASNQAKHGVSLAMASQLDWSLAVAKPDQRSDYGERRMIGYAPLVDRASAFANFLTVATSETVHVGRPPS